MHASDSTLHASRPTVPSGGAWPPGNAGRGRWFWLLIFAALLLLLVRVPLLSMPALWIDEAFSLYHARMPLAQLWGEGWRLESSPPLYYTVLWAWLRLVADNETSARLLSLLLTTFTALMVYRTARVLAGPLAGAAAVFVWLLSALGLEYSLEIRPYALQQLLIAVAIWAFVGLVQIQDATTRRNVWRAGFARALVLLIASVLTFYTHTTSLAFLGGLAAAGFYLGLARREGWNYWRVYVGLALAIAVMCLPQLFKAAGVLASNRSGLAWIPSALDFWVVLEVLRQWALGIQWWSLRISGPMTTVILAMIVACIWRVRSRPELVALGVVMAGTGAALLVLAGFIQSVLLPRTTLWLWLPIAIVLGCSAVSIRWYRGLWRPVLASAFLVVLSAAYGLYITARPIERPWFDTLHGLDLRVQPGERLIFIDAEIGCVVNEYAGKSLAALPRLRLDLGRTQRFRSGQRLNIRCNQMPTVEPAGIAPPGVVADWIVNDGFGQRADVANLLQGSNSSLKATETFGLAGQARITRVIRVNPQ